MERGGRALYQSHLVTESLDLVLVQLVLPVAGLHGGGEALHLSVQDTHHVLECAGFDLQLGAAAPQLGHLGLLAVELQLQRRAHRAGQRREGGGHGQRGGQGGWWGQGGGGGRWTGGAGAGGGGGGGGGGSLHGRPGGGGAELGDSGLQLSEGLLQLQQLVSGQLQALGLQALHAHLHAHYVVQQQVEVLVGVGALVVMDLFLFHLQKMGKRLCLISHHLRGKTKKCMTS